MFTTSTWGNLMISQVSNVLTNLLKNTNENNFDMFLDAYNRFVEDELGGVNFIFQPDVQEDLIELIKSGMTFKMIKEIGNDVKYISINPDGTFYGIRKENVKSTIYALMNEISMCVIKYPYVEEYKMLYNLAITDKLIDMEKAGM